MAPRWGKRRMIERIREAIGSQLVSMGVSDLDTLRETILIRNGLYCGRKLECQGHTVVWFVEEHQIKFFGPCGNLILATSPDQCLAAVPTQPIAFEQRRAA